ncbi:MAG: GIN domain-containing protein [Fibrobacterota bacterium]
MNYCILFIFLTLFSCFNEDYIYGSYSTEVKSSEISEGIHHLQLDVEYAEVCIISSAENRYTIETDDNILPWIDIRNTGGILEISKNTDRELLSSILKIAVYIPTDSLKTLHVSAGRLQCSDILTGLGEVVLSHTSGADLTVQSDEIRVELDSESSLELSGTGDYFSVSLADSAVWKNETFVPAHTDITLGDYAEAGIRTEDLLTYTMGSNASLGYIGHPVTEEISTGKNSRVWRIR